MPRRLAVIISLTLLASVVAIQPAHAYTTNSWENTVARHVNYYDRYLRHIPGLTTNQTLSSIAHAQSLTMARRGVLFHNPYLEKQVRGWSTLGENVGVGMSLADINRAFMASRYHRENILCRCFRQLGVGVVRDARGRYWVTQVFFG